MNATESLALTRFVRAACPQQKLDEYTPDAWHQLLEDLSFTDCKTAVVALAKRQPFVSPAEIRTEVRRTRDERIRADGREPDYDRDDVLGGLRAIRDHRAALADGASQSLPALPPGSEAHMARLTEVLDPRGRRFALPRRTQEAE